MCQERNKMRIGFASDIHQLIENRPLILAGVIVPAPYGELAHSDGDVVYHAVADSILGALALGDIGEYFPDNDQKTEGMSSSLILNRIYEIMNEKQYKIGNIDITIHLEEPKISAYKSIIRLNVARLLKTDITNVSIKAETNEKLDAIGQKKAVKAESIVLLLEK